MCGIVGFNWDDRPLVKKMVKTISYRGPDSNGFFSDRKVSLGHQRLKIIDLSPKASRPMFNKEEDVIIVYNGEIFNFKEIRPKLEKKYEFVSNSDTEVILHAYQEWGESCLEKFNGDFAFCIYDKKKDKLFLARDRMGVKPLYYYHQDGKFIFSSEIKSILETGVERKVNQEALNKYLAFRYNPSLHTLFDKIEKVAPGHYMILDLKTNKLSKKKYWDIKPEKNRKGLKHNKKILLELYKKSVSLRLVSDRPLGVYLSGGIDSASIVAMMDEKGREIKTFSLDFGEDKRNKDVFYAKQVADYFGTKHEAITVDPSFIKLLPKITYHTDEPLADPSTIPTYLLSKYVKDKITVGLTGVGGDEVFGGYTHYHFLRRRRLLRTLPTPQRAAKLLTHPQIGKAFPYLSSFGQEGSERFMKFLKAANDKSRFYLKIVSIFDEDERKELLGKNDVSLANEYRKKYFRERINYLKQIQMLEAKHFLVEDALMLTDKTSMSQGVEMRVPLLDHNIVQFGINLPERQKIRGFNEKYILKAAMRPYLPRAVIKRKKQAFFVPIDNWMKDEMMDDIRHLVMDQNPFNLNQAFLEKLFKKYPSSPLYTARQLWSIATLHTWHDTFFK